MPDERALPSDSNARLVAESLRDDYATDTSQAVALLARNDTRALDDLAASVSGMDDVVRVVAPSGTYERGKLVAGPVPGSEKSGAAYGLVYLSVATQSDAAQQLVHAIRAEIVDHQVEVGGPTATLIDTSAAVGDRLPVAILLIALATFVLLFLFTGSIIVPIKALVLNLLMLSAVLGTMVWIFQDGHLARILGVTPAPLNLSMVVLLCCIAFSLSVDYEIFLISRIKEARDSGLSNNDAIVVGLGRVGRIISSAAVLLTITLLSFANGLSFMKMFGIGTALAIVIDATVIRGVVVPAFLRVAGDLNWWAPAPLTWLHARIGVSEAPTDIAIPPPAQPDEETQRLSPLRTPEPDTVRYPRPTPQPDEETQRLSPLRTPEPDTVRYSTPKLTRDVAATIPAQRRPRHRYVILDDNSTFDIDRDCLIGRAPHRSNAVQRGLRPIRIEDRTGAISEAHAELRWVNGEVLIVDRGSTNGVFMCAPGRQAWTRVTPWQLAVWRPGTSVRIGNRILRLQAPHEGAPR